MKIRKSRIKKEGNRERENEEKERVRKRGGERKR